jgi:hypothetical protein
MNEFQKALLINIAATITVTIVSHYTLKFLNDKKSLSVEKIEN